VLFIVRPYNLGRGAYPSNRHCIDARPRSRKIEDCTRPLDAGRPRSRRIRHHTMAIRARKPPLRPTADSRVPRYLQVASVLTRRIRDGHWSVGGRIATLEELEHEFGVARVTVRQAID